MSERRLALALALAGLTGCQSPKPKDVPADTGPLSGDARLAAGDYDGAARIFERDETTGVGGAATTEKLATARRLAAAAHAHAAERAVEAGDLDRAVGELSRADGYGRDVPAVRDAHAVVDARLASAVRGDDAPRRRAATLAAAAEESADAAAEAWTRRERDRVVALLDAAQFAGTPVSKAETLRRAIERDLVAETPQRDEAALRAAVEFAEAARLHPSIVRTLRDLLVDRLVAAANDLRTTRRPTTAALLEIEAKRLRGDVKTPALDEVRDRITTTIVVMPFTVESGVKVDGGQFARALRERMVLDAIGGGAPVKIVAESGSTEALRVTGRILSARTSEGRVGRENRRVPFQSGTARRPNPEYDALNARIQEAADAVRTARRDRDDAAALVAHERSAGFQPATTSTQPGVLETTSRLAVAQNKLDLAETELRRAGDLESLLRQRLKTTPREIDAPVMDERIVVVTTKVKTAQATVHLDLLLGVDPILRQDFAASAEHRETVSDGLPAAGVAVDPDETPDDDAMAAKLADRFAAIASGPVRAAVQPAARHRLDTARRAEQDGRRDEAAEWYALYLLSTPEVASPERADAARALADLLGVRVALRTGARRASR